MPYYVHPEGAEAESPLNAIVVAIVDGITIMGSLDAVKSMDSVRERLQKPANYQVNLTKQMSTPRTKIKWQRFKASYKTT
jgi:hypothetical protein